MKKIMLLSNDFDLNVNLGAVLYRFNFRINCFQSEQGVMDDFDNGNRYDLYVLDMKAKDINLKLVKFLRENKNLTPILLVLDEAIPTLFKKIYYAKVDDFIIRPFSPDEFIFHVFKLCKVLLGSKFEFKNGLVFDKDALCVTKGKEKIYLGKKESLFLEILAKNSPHVVTYEELDHHLYKGESLSQDRLRSLIREIRQKIPALEITTIRGIGYKIE
ncbi:MULTISPECIES: response regulator transcription factor [Campylobacter]|jgi:putative response regulator arlR|uniref:Signal transduction response regulator n=1 Tax=Campylobacter curvus (strain 525.92) TaxID=360105 RepID=A7GVY9_CAMC5|nr:MULTISPECIES: winged helix-turn-helix domain-containing protein [Campylobacter]EAT99723.1 signal transduction response regulator [Campylobacter curvus 525.92]EJP76092.1 transcriptional regulatory protein, C-terminal domain protein [Campylobacter sp. FOBRC14]MBN7288030.1 response regulator transcription factor [Campylobacter curvus]MDU6827470.1 winged helix-turn-helix domain-containing protein [Campylobacter sp.]